MIRKLAALLLSLAMVFSLAACGDGYKTDKNAKAEDIFSAAAQNLASTLKTMLDKDAEATHFSFDLNGSFNAALKLGADEKSPEAAITGKLDADGLADNKKGASVTYQLETDAMKVLGSLLGGLGGGSQGGSQDQTLKFEGAAYVDLASNTAYIQDPSEKSWSTSSLDLAALKTQDMKELETLSLSQLFETHSFQVEKDKYVIEGTATLAKADLNNLSSLGGEYAGMAGQLGSLIKDLKAQVKLEINPDKKLTGLELSVSNYSLDLGALMGMSASIKELKLDLDIEYKPVSYKLPDEVKSAAAGN